jgi:hypothetical protein
MRFPKLILTWTAAACLAGPSLPAKNRIDHREVNVSVYRLGFIPLDTEVFAENQARLLFSRIGLRIRFTREPAQDTETIELRIWDHAPPQLERYAMGRASVGDRQRHASIFYDRVMEFADRSDARGIGTILGYVIAHEIGHLLRDEPGHEPVGIMKATWSRRDAAEMMLGVVGFTGTDADRIFRVITMRRLALIREAEE